MCCPVIVVFGSPIRMVVDVPFEDTSVPAGVSAEAETEMSEIGVTRSKVAPAPAPLGLGPVQTKVVGMIRSMPWWATSAKS